MEQLWYTWSSVGFGRATGLRVRAASPGLVEVVNSLDRFEPLGLHLRYDLPDEREADILAPEDAATCLAFIRPGRDPHEQQRILVNKRFSGFDFEHRPHPFCHLLTAFPPSFTAHEAITLWKSEKLWKYSAETLNASTLALDPLPDDLGPHSGPLKDADVQEVRPELPFVIQAFLLLLGKGQRLSIAAHPDAVARMLWGLTRVVPRGLLKELTFSTYEKDVTKSQALIVGTCWSSTAKRGEPGPLQHFQANWELAINWYTGELSPQLKAASDSLEADYARFAAAALLDNQHKGRLDSLLQRAERRRIATVDAFLAEYQSVVKSVITKQVIVTTLSDPQLAADDLDLDTWRDKIIDYAVEERRQEKKRILPQLATLRQQADFAPRGLLARRLAALAVTAAEESIKALRERKEARAWGTLEVLATSAPPQVAPEVWRDLFTQVTQQGLMPSSPDLYHWLVQQWAQIHTWLDAKLMRQWLNFGWERLEREGGVQWPDEWYPLYIHHLLRAPLPPKGAQLVGRHLGRFQIAFQELARDPEEWGALIQFIGTFAQEGKKPEKTELISAILAARRLDRAHAQQLFQAARLTADEVLMLLEQRSKSGAVEAFFDLLCVDKTWREQEGRKIIQRLEKQIEAGGDQGIMRRGLQLAGRLNPRSGKSGALVMATVTMRLIPLATTALPIAVRQRQASFVSFLQDLLSSLAPARLNPQPWLSLLNELAYEPTMREQIRPWLLKETAHIGNLDEPLIAPWLQGSTWEDFIALFKRPLPEVRLRAMLTALLEDQAAALPPAVPKLVEKEEPWFLQTLPYLFVNGSQQGVISFFGKLVKQGYSRKQSLLIPLLSVQGITIAQVEAFWAAAALNKNRAEEQQVLETMAPYLVTHGLLGPHVTDSLTRYLPNMTPENVEDKEKLLVYLRSHIARPEGKALVQPLEAFIQRALQMIQGPIRQGEEKQRSDWARLLAAAAPAEREDVPWEKLLLNLPSPQKLNLLARLLEQKTLKRRQAEEWWASAALNAAERQQFLRQSAGPLLQHPQVPGHVKKFLQDALGNPPARANIPPVEAPQSAPNAAAEGISLPVRPAGEAAPPAPREQPRGSQAEETEAFYPNNQLAGPARMPAANQQVLEPPSQGQREMKSAGASEKRQPPPAPEAPPYGREFWDRKTIDTTIAAFVSSPSADPKRLALVAQAFEQMPPGSKRDAERSRVLVALTQVIKKAEDLEASLPVLVPGLAGHQEEGFQLLVNRVRKQAQEQEMNSETLAAKIHPYLQWLFSQQTAYKGNLLDEALKNFLPKTLVLIDKHAKNWPPGLYQQWKTYRQQRYGVNLERGGIRGLWERHLALWLYLTVPVIGVILFLILYYLLIIVFKVSLF